MSLSFDYYRPTPLESAKNLFIEKKKVYFPYEIDLELATTDFCVISKLDGIVKRDLAEFAVTSEPAYAEEMEFN